MTSSRATTPTRCASSSPSPGRRARTPTSRGRSSCAATTTSSSRTGATSSTATLALAYRNFGAVPEPGALTPEDEEVIAAVEAGFAIVGEQIGAARFSAAITEAMRLADRVNQYASDQAPWATIKTDRERAATVLYVLLRAVDNLKIIFTPFLPFSSQALHELLGYEGWIAGPLEFRTRRGGRRRAPGAHRRLCVVGRPVGAERAAARPDARGAEAAVPEARSGAGACATSSGSRPLDRDRLPRAPRFHRR